MGKLADLYCCFIIKQIIYIAYYKGNGVNLTLSTAIRSISLTVCISSAVNCKAKKDIR